MDTNHKLLVIGLDGATFQIIKPLVQEGRMPTLKKLLSSGTHAVLTSTLDSNSPCAWSTYITGKNPARHGIFGFFDTAPGSYQLRFLNGSFRSGKSLWRILSENGKRVGVVNVPFSYPVEPVNGLMIGGPDSPNKSDDGFAYPKGLIKELEQASGKYVIEAGASALVRQGKLDLALEKLKECIDSRVSAVSHLLRSQDFDFFMAVFTESDRVQHHFWKFLNPLHPAYGSREAKRYGGAIHEIYERLDRAVAQVMDAAGDRYSVLIMSDHGAGPSSNKSFFLNRWLASVGHLTFKNDSSVKGSVKQGIGQGFGKIVGDAYVLVNSRFSRPVKRWLRNTFPGLKSKASSILRGLNIDWDKTKAFSWENAPTIFINRKGKFPRGTVADGLEYETVCDTLIQRLMALRSKNGEPMVERVIRKEEAYDGPFIDRAPDLFIEWKDDQYTVRPGYAAKGNCFIEEATAERIKKVETISRASGVHKPDGVFLVSGKDVLQGKEIGSLRLHDVTASILYYLGVPIPSDLDGRVATEIFSEQLLDSRKVCYTDASSDSEASDVTYSDDESNIIADRLKGLGYID